jgi:phospholipid-binding lipoprotein MlaA
LVGWVQDNPARLGLTGLRLVDLRADVLQAGRVIEGAALDKYTFVREAYLQRRRGVADLPKTRPEPEERFDLPEKPDTVR